MTFSAPTYSCHSLRFKNPSVADPTSNILWWHGNLQQYPPHLTLHRTCALVLRQLSVGTLRWLWNQINLKSLYNSQSIKLTQFQNWFHFAWEWTSVAFKILYHFSFFMKYSSFLYTAADLYLCLIKTQWDWSDTKTGPGPLYAKYIITLKSYRKKGVKMSCTWTELEPQTLSLVQINHSVTSVGHLSAYFGNKVDWFPVLNSP